MNNLGKLLFMHFEKILIGLFFVGLGYSFVAYGPWTVRRDFSVELTAISNDLAARPVTEASDVPKAPDMVAEYIRSYNIQEQTRLADPMVWPILRLEQVDILPPADVVAEPNRGYNAVKWEINPNQSDTRGAFQFVGVEVDRAIVTEEGMGPFEVRTQVSDRLYLTPAELYALAQRVASVTLQKEVEARKRTQATESGPAGQFYTIDDLFNAMHDGLIDEQQLRRLVADGVRKGYFAAEDQAGLRETFMGLRQAMQETRRGVSAAQRSSASQVELQKRALESMGYRGGGGYGAYIAAPVEQKEEPTETAKPAEAPQVVVQFADIAMFVDTAVSPDLEYTYKVKFWALQTTESKHQLRSTEFAPETPIVSPKPDTEFYLTGIIPEQDKASIMVRKWKPISNSWVMETFAVAPGEQIGRVVVKDVRDTAGRLILDGAGRPKREPVDFSTDCVLLASRLRPRSFATRTGPSTGESLSVDNAEYVLYDWPQIVYSDRKGALRVKWKGSAESS